MYEYLAIAFSASPLKGERRQGGPQRFVSTEFSLVGALSVAPMCSPEAGTHAVVVNDPGIEAAYCTRCREAERRWRSEESRERDTSKE